MTEETRFRLSVAGGIVVVLLMGGGSWLALNVLDAKPQDGSGERRTKIYRRTLVENLRVTRHGVRGVDFIRCGACRMEKRKNGFLTFGGLNVLVMEDLSVVLPGAKDGEERDSPSEGEGVRGIVRRMGVSDGFLRDRGLPVRFSGLRIRNLSVGRLSGTNMVERSFAAQSAEAVRGGLRLSGCMVYGRQDGEPVPVRGAMLALADRRLHLSWDGGEMDLN